MVDSFEFCSIYLPHHRNNVSSFKGKNNFLTGGGGATDLQKQSIWLPDYGESMLEKMNSAPFHFSKI